jgi:hypothetical protein
MKTKIDCDDKTCFYKFKLFFCGRVALCCGWRACKNNRANKLVETDNIIHIPPVCRAPSCCSPRASRDCGGASRDCGGASRDCGDASRDCGGASRDCGGASRDCGGASRDCGGASRDCSIDDVDSAEGSKGKCAICKNGSDDIVILPCGHGDHCTACLENWYDTNDACPICGDTTIDVVQCL